MNRLPEAGDETEPGDNPPSPGSVLPRRYSPLVAGYAPGPFLTPAFVTPSAWRWRNVRTYVVTLDDGTEYRAIRVTSWGTYVGYWAVEQLGQPLPGFEEGQP